jgi:hypothetical protein
MKSEENVNNLKELFKQVKGYKVLSIDEIFQFVPKDTSFEDLQITISSSFKKSSKKLDKKQKLK